MKHTRRKLRMSSRARSGKILSTMISSGTFIMGELFPKNRNLSRRTPGIFLSFSSIDSEVSSHAVRRAPMVTLNMAMGDGVG